MGIWVRTISQPFHGAHISVALKELFLTAALRDAAACRLPLAPVSTCLRARNLHFPPPFPPETLCVHHVGVSWWGTGILACQNCITQFENWQQRQCHERSPFSFHLPSQTPPSPWLSYLSEIHLFRPLPGFQLIPSLLCTRLELATFCGKLIKSPKFTSTSYTHADACAQWEKKAIYMNYEPNKLSNK